MSLPCGMHGFGWEVCCHLNCCFPLGAASLGCFRIFLSLVFRNVVMMCLHVHFLGFILFGFLLEPVGLCLLPNLASFSHYFFKYSFSATLLLSFWNSKDTHVGSFVIVPEALSFFLLSLFCLCCSVWVNSTSCSLIFILSHLHSTTEPIQWGFRFC